MTAPASAPLGSRVAAKPSVNPALGSRVAAKAPPPARPRGKRWALLAVILLLCLAVAGGAYWALTPDQPREYSDPVSVEDRSGNTRLYLALVAGGINDPFVDVGQEHAFVAYEGPADPNESALRQEFVLGAAAQASPLSARIVSLQLADGIPALRWSADTKDVQAFLEGDITHEQLDSRIEKVTL